MFYEARRSRRKTLLGLQSAVLERKPLLSGSGPFARATATMWKGRAVSIQTSSAAGAVEQPRDQLRVEDVVMDGAIRRLIEGPLLEGLAGQAIGHPLQVAQLDEFPDVRRIVLGGRALEVLLDVVEHRHGPCVVERVLQVRYDEDQVTFASHDPLPLGERAQGIRDVLERVGGQHDVVRAVGDAVQGCSVSDEPPAGRSVVVVPERRSLGGVAVPDRGVGEVAVVESVEEGVERQRAVAPEDRGGTADLQTTSLLDERPTDLVGLETRPEAIPPRKPRHSPWADRRQLDA